MINLIEVNYFGYNDEKGLFTLGRAWLDVESITCVQEHNKHFPERIKIDQELFLVELRTGTKYMIDKVSVEKLIKMENTKGANYAG